MVFSISTKHSSIFSSDIGYNIDSYNVEKNQQLHTILAIIVSVFGACCVVLVAYMIIFPASSSSTVTTSNTMTSSSTQPTPQTVPLIKRNSQFIEEKVNILNPVELCPSLLRAVIQTRPNRSTRSEDHTQMILF